jgi:hypothetical protein
MGLFCDPCACAASPRPCRPHDRLASVLAVLAVGCNRSNAPSTSSTPSGASSVVSAQHSPGGAIHFPATLFGFHQDTGTEAQKVDRDIAQLFAMMRMFTHPHLALYGPMTTGDVFIVGVTDLTDATRKVQRKAFGGFHTQSFPDPGFPGRPVVSRWCPRRCAGMRPHDAGWRKWDPVHATRQKDHEPGIVFRRVGVQPERCRLQNQPGSIPVGG